MPAVFCCCQKTKRRGNDKFSSISGKIAPKKTPSFVREVKIFVVAQARVCSEGGGKFPQKHCYLRSRHSSNILILRKEIGKDSFAEDFCRKTLSLQ